jgi:putative PIN family toxin of toxin-antitoxin system
MHTVLDTNILISALLFRGSISAIHREIVLGVISAFVSPPMVREYARVLAYPKFGLSEEELIYLLEEEIGRYFKPVEAPSDDCFINTALACPGSVLVSGDRHILEARERLLVPVITAAELMERLGRN